MYYVLVNEIKPFIGQNYIFFWPKICTYIEPRQSRFLKNTYRQSVVILYKLKHGRQWKLSSTFACNSFFSKRGTFPTKIALSGPSSWEGKNGSQLLVVYSDFSEMFGYNVCRLWRCIHCCSYKLLQFPSVCFSSYACKILTLHAWWTVIQVSHTHPVYCHLKDTDCTRLNWLK